MCECNRSREAEVQRKRGDFFRDQLAVLTTCPTTDLLPRCVHQHDCAYLVDGEADYAACWDEVERRQR